MSERNSSAQQIDSRLSALKAFFEHEQELIVHEAVRSRGACLCAEIVRRLDGYASNFASAPLDVDKGWIKILSLTTVRNVVGGRFDLLKERWINAGLPLKQHRGSGIPRFTKNEEGWGGFIVWLFKHGYEMREVNPESGSLFEIRKL